MREWLERLLPLTTGLIGIVIGVFAPYWLRLVDFRLSRREMRWRHAFDLFTQIEERVGCVYEKVGGYPNYDDEAQRSEIVNSLMALESLTGRASRYPAVVQALRDLHHTAAIFVADKGRFATAQEDKDMRAQLREQHQAVYVATQKALDQM